MTETEFNRIIEFTDWTKEEEALKVFTDTDVAEYIINNGGKTVINSVASEKQVKNLIIVNINKLRRNIYDYCVKNKNFFPMIWLPSNAILDYLSSRHFLELKIKVPKRLISALIADDAKIFYISKIVISHPYLTDVFIDASKEIDDTEKTILLTDIAVACIKNRELELAEKCMIEVMKVDFDYAIHHFFAHFGNNMETSDFSRFREKYLHDPAVNRIVATNISEVDFSYDFDFKQEFFEDMKKDIKGMADEYATE